PDQLADWSGLVVVRTGGGDGAHRRPGIRVEIQGEGKCNDGAGQSGGNQGPAPHSTRCSPAFSRRSRSSRSSSGVGSNWAGSGSASRPESPKSFSKRAVVP